MNESQKRQDVEEIDLRPLLAALWKRAWAIALAALIFGVAAFFGTKAFVAPTYRTSFTAYVNNRTDTEGLTSMSSADLSASKSLVYTYAEIITSRSVLQAAAQQAGLNYTYDKLADMVSTSVSSDTVIIEVFVKALDPAEAVALASAIAELSPDYVSQIVEGSSMRVVDAPVQPTGIYSPSYTKNAALGAMLGIILSAGAIILFELLNDKVRSGEDLESRYGITVIGTIPNVASAEKGDNQYGYGYAQGGGKRK